MKQKRATLASDSLRNSRAVELSKKLELFKKGRRPNGLCGFVFLRDFTPCLENAWSCAALLRSEDVGLGADFLPSVGATPKALGDWLRAHVAKN